jgi:hypothetical protein
MPVTGNAINMIIPLKIQRIWDLSGVQSFSIMDKLLICRIAKKLKIQLLVGCMILL